MSQTHRNLRLAAVALGTVRCPCGIDDSTFLNAWTHASPERHQPTGPQVERARFARSLTAPPRCEPSAAWNVKWYTWVCQKRRDNCLQTSWLWRAGAIRHCSTPHNLNAIIHGESSDIVEVRWTAVPPRSLIEKILPVSTVLGHLRKMLHAVSCENKSSSHIRHELTNPSALPTQQNIMCPRGADDDVWKIGRCTNTNPCVTVLRQIPHTTH